MVSNAFPGIHCTFRKVCKSNNQHIRQGVGAEQEELLDALIKL